MMKFHAQQHRYQSFHLLPSVKRFVSCRKGNTRRQCEEDVESIIFQEGIPIRIEPKESAWDWRQDISFRSFVLYEVNGDLVGSLCGRDGQLYGYSLLYWTQATADEKRRCIEQMRRFVEQERMSERPSSL